MQPPRRRDEVFEVALDAEEVAAARGLRDPRRLDPLEHRNRRLAFDEVLMRLPAAENAVRVKSALLERVVRRPELHEERLEVRAPLALRERAALHPAEHIRVAEKGECAEEVACRLTVSRAVDLSRCTSPEMKP